jgi:DNA-directed RNA polymerase sigma subunit (sigma70/sigma32)
MSKEEKITREDIITKMLEKRYTYQEIGDILGITKQRVHSISKKNKLADQSVSNIRGKN